MCVCVCTLWVRGEVRAGLNQHVAKEPAKVGTVACLLSAKPEPLFLAGSLAVSACLPQLRLSWEVGKGMCEAPTVRLPSLDFPPQL